MLVKKTTREAKKFYHHTFEIKRHGRSKHRHTLLVNPEDISQNEPTRMSVTQTLGGAYVVDFGQGLIEVSISGTTGYKARYNSEGEYVDGFEEFINFRENIYRDFIQNSDNGMEMFWYNWEDDEYYQIQPKSFRLMRNKQAPLLYRYEFQFICLAECKRSRYPKLTEKQVNTIDILMDAGRIHDAKNKLKRYL
jgi:hypothetical protein